MPLDFCICSTAKLELDRMTSREMPWVEKVQLYQDIPDRAPVVATINAYISRLNACIEAGGEHLHAPRKTAQSR